MHSVAARVAWRYSWRDGVERHKIQEVRTPNCYSYAVECDLETFISAVRARDFHTLGISLDIILTVSWCRTAQKRLLLAISHELYSTVLSKLCWILKAQERYRTCYMKINHSVIKKRTSVTKCQKILYLSSKTTSKYTAACYNSEKHIILKVGKPVVIDFGLTIVSFKSFWSLESKTDDGWELFDNFNKTHKAGK